MLVLLASRVQALSQHTLGVVCPSGSSTHLQPIWASTPQLCLTIADDLNCLTLAPFLLLGVRSRAHNHRHDDTQRHRNGNCLSAALITPISIQRRQSETAFGTELCMGFRLLSAVSTVSQCHCSRLSKRFTSAPRYPTSANRIAAACHLRRVTSAAESTLLARYWMLLPFCALFLSTLVTALPCDSEQEWQPMKAQQWLRSFTPPSTQMALPSCWQGRPQSNNPARTLQGWG